jgi:hypothetical protein
VSEREREFAVKIDQRIKYVCGTNREKIISDKKTSTQLQMMKMFTYDDSIFEIKAKLP